MECPACEHPNVDGARYCAKCGALLPPPRVEGQDPLIGTILGGRFRVTGMLGEGGMGRVYTAEQPMGTSIRKVAVKTLLTEFSQDPTVVQRFMRECGTVVELEHPNTIKFHDFGRTDSGELYIAMEFVDGKSLADEVARGPMPPERVENIMKQICGSLHEAHTKGVIHRDLKPENVILTNRAGETDFVKVLDFGIAKRSEASDQAKEQKLTQAGMVLGTPPYMSPEQFMGKELDARSDIYSLGVMAYEMLAGKLPFEASTPWEWATQHMTVQPFPFERTTTMAAQIPATMKQAIMRALSKDKTQRQDTAKQFYAELTGGPAATGELRASASLGGAPAGGTAAMAAAGASVGRPGATQIGEPFAAPGMGPGPGVSMPGPMGGAPMPMPTTGGGQAIPSPPMAGRSQGGGGNKGLLIGVAALVAVGLVVGLVLVLKGKSGEESDEPLIAVNTSTADTSTAGAGTSPPEPTESAPSADASSAATDTPATPTATSPGTATGAKSPTQYCEAAISAAQAKSCSAAKAALAKCSGAKQPTAAANVGKYCPAGGAKFRPGAR